MISLLTAELIKHGRRPLYRRLLLALPILLLLAAVSVLFIRFTVGVSDFEAESGAGISFATNLFGLLGVISAVAVAAGVGSAEYDFGTARLIFVEEPRRWRHAIVRVIWLIGWFVALVALTALAGLVLDLAIGLHRAGPFDGAAWGREFGFIGRSALVAFPTVLIGLVFATLARHQLGGIFAALGYSLADRVIISAAEVPRGLAPAWLEPILEFCRQIAPAFLSGVGAAFEGRPSAAPIAVGALVLAVWIAVLIGLLVVTLERRDVTS